MPNDINEVNKNIRKWFPRIAISISIILVLDVISFFLFPLTDANLFNIFRFLLFPLLFGTLFIGIIVSVVLPIVAQQQSMYGMKPQPAVNADVSLASASKTGEAQERAIRAAESGNRKKQYSAPPVNWILFVYIAVTVITFFVYQPIGVPMFIGLFIWVTVRHFRSNSQINKYKKEYKNNGLEYSSVIEERKYVETLRGRSTMGTNGSYAWSIAMWEKFGTALMWREHILGRVAQQHNVMMQPLVIETPNEELVNPAFKSYSSTTLWQVRNMMILPDEEDGKYPVQFADLNNIMEAIVNKRPAPSLQLSSYMETWFPADDVLVVYPNRLTGYTEWRNIGETFDLGEPSFKKMFDARTSNPVWARLVLNPAVMEQLMKLSPVVLLIDNGRITLGRQGAWIEPEEIPMFTDTIRRIARSAKAAES